MNVFVIMPFNEDMNKIYEDVIKPQILDLGVEVGRADDIDKGQKNIMADIVKSICEADLVIADLTTRNPNVFYELGLAHAAKVPTFTIVQSTETIPFDLTQYRHFVYSTHYRQIDALKKKLTDVINEVRECRYSNSNPFIDFEVNPSRTLLDNNDFGQSTNEELGIWDYAAQADEALVGMNAIFVRIVENVNGIDKKVKQRAAKISQLKETRGQIGVPSQVHQEINLMAGELRQLAKQVETELPILQSKWEAIPESIAGLLKFSDPASLSDQQAIAKLKNDLEASREKISGFIVSLQNMRSSLTQGRGIAKGMNSAITKLDDTFLGLVRAFEKGNAEISRTQGLLQGNTSLASGGMATPS